MLVLISIVVGISVAAILVAGLLALLRNPNKLQNRWFFGFAAFITLWIPFNFFDSNFVVPFWTNITLKLDFISALFLGWAFVEFVEAFSINDVARHRASLRIKLAQPLTFIANLIFIPVILSGLVVTSSITSHSLKVHYGSLFNAYAALIGIYFIYGLGRLFYRRIHAAPREKPALNLILAGLGVMIVANIMTNLVFPLLINKRSTVQLLNIIGYLGVVVFAFLMYLAITTQRLFDIRLIVARSLGYILSLVSLAALFTLITFAAIGLVFKNNISQTETRWVYTLFAVSLALFFPALKRFFDVTTNKLFYRDAYDAQLFLDELNNLLVSTYEIKPLLEGSARIITDNIKADYCIFGIGATKTTPHWIRGTKYVAITDRDIDLIRSATEKLEQKVIVADELNDLSDHLREVLQKYKITVVARLSSSAREGGIGYLFLGAKKSGNVYSSQDVKVLEIVANELVIAIQNALRFEEIENFNVTLQGRVDDATKKLRHANEKLKALDETKDDFISMASHQLRTPLTSIKGYISMVLEGDAGKLTHMEHEMLGQAFFSSQRMVYLIADLLNISRLKTGKFIIEPAKVNLAEVVEQELGQLEETAASRSLTLTYEKPKQFPDLMLDETKTRQVIMNFVDNAIYYTPANGHVIVRLVNNPTTVELRVEDDGIGVPKHEQPHLFTKFYRAGNARKARPDGTGLGLFMAKKVVIAQEGSLIFESQEDKGSTFGFIFSKRKLGVPEAAVKPSVQAAKSKTDAKA